jgi:hypothetical protein
MARTASWLVPRLIPRLILVAGSVAIGAAGAVALRADLLVGYGFNRVLGARTAVTPFELGAPAGVAQAEVGDEGYWLTRTSIDSHAPLDRRLAVGDRITITGREGPARTLEVVDLKSFAAPLLKVAADGAPVHLVRVTARVVGTAEGRGNELVRFYLEVEETKPAAAPGGRQART